MSQVVDLIQLKTNPETTETVRQVAFVKKKVATLFLKLKFNNQSNRNKFSRNFFRSSFTLTKSNFCGSLENPRKFHVIRYLRNPPPPPCFLRRWEDACCLTTENHCLFVRLLYGNQEVERCL